MKTLANEILQEQTEQLLKDADLKTILSTNIDRLIKSGAIDTENIKSNDYSTAKAILAVSLETFGRRFEPLHKAGKREANNLRHFL